MKKTESAKGTKSTKKELSKGLSRGLSKKNYTKLVKVYLKKQKTIVCNQQLADEIGCCKEIVRASIRQLIKDGEPIATFWGKGHKYTTSLMEHQHCLDVSKRVTAQMERRNDALLQNIDKIASNSTINKLK